MTNGKSRPSKPHHAEGNAQTYPQATQRNKVDLRNGEAIARELARVYREARTGAIDLRSACQLAFLLTSLARLREIGVIEARLSALESTPSERSPLVP